MTSVTLRCTLTIRSFKHRGLKRLYERGDRSGVRPDLFGTVERILTVLDPATSPEALGIPGYRLHPLKGDFMGFWSVTVRATGASFSALKEWMRLMLN
ncbi:MAG: type II toxin-antitoxin system RelE/ParE family toxin [Bryobacteraceae bacterium]